jgi:hypothetical protein
MAAINPDRFNFRPSPIAPVLLYRVDAARRGATGAGAEDDGTPLLSLTKVVAGEMKTGSSRLLRR